MEKLEIVEPNLTEEEKVDLIRYAETLRDYIDPRNRQFFPIGWKHYPRIKCSEILEICNRKYYAEKRLCVEFKSGLGDWRLRMVGETVMPGGWYWDENFIGILPIYSRRKNILEFLALQMEQAFKSQLEKFAKIGIRKLPCDERNFYVSSNWISSDRLFGL